MISYGGNCRYIRTEEQKLTMKCRFCGKEKPTNDFKHTLYRGNRVQACKRCAELLMQNLTKKQLYEQTRAEKDEEHE